MFGAKKDPSTAAAAARPAALSIAQEPTFAEQLAGMAKADRARLDAMKPKERAQAFAEWFQHDEPVNAASKILEYHSGDARAAEVDAWAFYELVTGVSIEDRLRGAGNAKAGEYGRAMIDHIVKGTEDPPVKRRVVPRKSFM